jgi:hypothetical protein
MQKLLGWFVVSLLLVAGSANAAPKVHKHRHTVHGMLWSASKKAAKGVKHAPKAVVKGAVAVAKHV